MTPLEPSPSTLASVRATTDQLHAREFFCWRRVLPFGGLSRQSVRNHVDMSGRAFFIAGGSLSVGGDRDSPVLRSRAHARLGCLATEHKCVPINHHFQVVEPASIKKRFSAQLRLPLRETPNDFRTDNNHHQHGAAS